MSALSSSEGKRQTRSALIAESEGKLSESSRDRLVKGLTRGDLLRKVSKDEHERLGVLVQAIYEVRSLLEPISLENFSADRPGNSHRLNRSNLRSTLMDYFISLPFDRSSMLDRKHFPSRHLLPLPSILLDSLQETFSLPTTRTVNKSYSTRVSKLLERVESFHGRMRDL